MSGKMWIVSEVGWEYNDENYYRPESMGVTPQKAFTLKELAEEYALEQNIEFFKHHFSGARNMYARYDIRDWCGYDGLNNEGKGVLKKYNLPDSGEISQEKLDSLKFKDFEEILNVLNFSWYEVVEVDLEL